MRFFIRKAKRRELSRICKEFDHKTADYRGESIWDLREFLMLLNLADNEKLGKSKSIIYAYKLGYLEGNKGTLDKIREFLERKSHSNCEE